VCSFHSIQQHFAPSEVPIEFGIILLKIEALCDFHVPHKSERTRQGWGHWVDTNECNTAIPL